MVAPATIQLRSNLLSTAYNIFNFLSRILKKPVSVITNTVLSAIKVTVYGRRIVSNKRFAMKLSVIFVTFGLAILANGDYTNPHWPTGS